jgi:hypothetical protein
MSMTRRCGHHLFCGLALGLWALCVHPSETGAQCDVSVGDPELLFDGDGIAVRMAWDRIGDQPAALWLDAESNELVFRKYDGVTWGPEEVVDKDTDTVPAAFDIRGWRMAALAFDSAGEPHVVYTRGPDAAPDETVTVDIMYVHRIGSAGWTMPEKIGELETEYTHDESLIELDFDPQGRLHAAYSGYGAGYTITHLFRQDGAWSSPAVAVTGASAVDMAVDPDGCVHIVFARRQAGLYQAFYKGSLADGSWPDGDGLLITSEPAIDCPAGPVACWPAITADRNRGLHVAYGVDPDPCCNAGFEDPCVVDEPYDEVVDNGHVSYLRGDGATWDAVPTVVLTGTKLHGPLPEVLVDPPGVIYVMNTNRSKYASWDALTGSFSPQQTYHTATGDWYHVDAVATGQGAWYAFRTSSGVYVIRFSRTGDCGGSPQCVEGDRRRCGLCGTQECGADSLWGACTAEGECLPGLPETCGSGGTRVCGFDCTWGVCEAGADPDDIEVPDVPDGSTDTIADVPADQVQDGAPDAPADPWSDGPDGGASAESGCSCSLLF